MSREDVIRELKQTKETKEAYNQAIDDAIEMVREDVERREFWTSTEAKERINFLIATIKSLKKWPPQHS